MNRDDETKRALDQIEAFQRDLEQALAAKVEDNHARLTADHVVKSGRVQYDFASRSIRAYDTLGRQLTITDRQQIIGILVNDAVQSAPDQMLKEGVKKTDPVADFVKQRNERAADRPSPFSKSK